MGKGLRRKTGEINDLNTELGGKDLREEMQKIWGKKALGGKGEGVEKILGRKGRRSEEKRPTGKGWKKWGGKDLNKERVGNILGRKGGGRS